MQREIAVGKIDLLKFTACLRAGGWTNFHEFRLTETEGGVGHLCICAIISTTGEICSRMSSSWLQVRDPAGRV